MGTGPSADLPPCTAEHAQPRQYVHSLWLSSFEYCRMGQNEKLLYISVVRDMVWVTWGTVIPQRTAIKKAESQYVGEILWRRGPLF